MNPFCIYCGARLEMDILMDRAECPACGETRTRFDMIEDTTPKPLHGEKCKSCDGEGYIEIETSQDHPYGDTVATEYLTEIDDCDECNGKGAHLDDETCIVCGLAVKNGWNLNGWEVHEGCHDPGEETPEKGSWD